MNTSIFVKTIKNLVTLLAFAIPRRKVEWAIFLSVCIFYAGIALYCAFVLGISLTEKYSPMGYDVYAYNTGERPSLFFEVRHPMMYWTMLPIISLNYVAAIHPHYWCVLTAFAILVNALSTTMIYKICRMIKVSYANALICVLFYLSLAVTMLLSFNFETYVMSQFFLLLLTAYTMGIDKNVYKDNIILYLVSSVTSSNCAKVFMIFILHRGG